MQKLDRRSACETQTDSQPLQTLPGKMQREMFHSPHKLQAGNLPSGCCALADISLMSGNIAVTLDFQTSVGPVWPCLLAGAQAYDQTDLLFACRSTVCPASAYSTCRFVRKDRFTGRLRIRHKAYTCLALQLALRWLVCLLRDASYSFNSEGQRG